MRGLRLIFSNLIPMTFSMPIPSKDALEALLLRIIIEMALGIYMDSDLSILA